MKNIFKYTLLLAAAGMMTAGFTSCSDSDDPVPPQGSVVADAATMSTMTANYVNNVVYPTYSDLKDAAEELHKSCVQLYSEKKAGSVKQSTIDAACDAFKAARRYWEQSEGFLYGPATDDGIDPHMDSWPLDQSQMTDALTRDDVVAGIEGENGPRYVYENNGDFDSSLGFHGLEFVLFRFGANRTAEAYNAEFEDGKGLNTKGENAAVNAQRLQTVTTLAEAAFAAAVSGDLANMTKLLYYEWNGDKATGDYLNANASWVVGDKASTLKALLQTGIFYGDELMTLKVSDSWPGTLAQIIEGCRSICEEVHTQKLAQAYHKATGTGTQDEAADYIESPYSQRSFIDYQDNIYSCKNSLYGVRGTETVATPANGSIMDFLLKNYPQGENLNNALNTAINTLEKAKKSGTSFIADPANPQVKECIDAVEALDDALQAAEDWSKANIIIR